MVKVFGILHLVLAGIGLVGALFGLLMALMGNPFLKFAGNSPGMKAQLDAQMAMQDRLAPMTIASGVLSFVVAIPMVIAGIKLLKKRRDCLAWSNGYAFTSLGAKAVNLVLTFTIMIPAMNGMMRDMIKGPGGESAMKMVSGFSTGGAILGIIVSCAYPVLTLVMLNRPAVKQWVATLHR